MKRETFVRYALPTLAMALALIGWEAVVRFNDIPPVILPSPSLIIATLIKDWKTLGGSLEVTLSITLQALIAATLGGALLALIFAQWKVVEEIFFPFAVIMQVTPGRPSTNT